MDKKDYSTNWDNLVSHFGYGFVCDLEQYKFIVKIRAYTDMQPRTIHGLGDFRKTPENNDKLDDLFNKIAKALKTFVIDDPVKCQCEFDDWHKEICNNFVNEFNEITKDFSVDTIEFGKGQKLINCSLKYIYCLKGADEYKEKFEHCHMILDRYTYSEGFYKKEVINAKGTLTSWSMLGDDEYYRIQQNIRNYLKGTTEYVDSNGIQLTPFQTEFFVFDKYQKLLNTPKASKESKAEQ